MPLSAEDALDGVNEEEALCGGLITKVIRKKKAPPAKTYRVARALFSRGRLISEASLPVFQRGWGRIARG